MALGCLWAAAGRTQNLNQTKSPGGHARSTYSAVQCRGQGRCCEVNGCRYRGLVPRPWLLVARDQQKAAYSWPVCSPFPALSFENCPCLRGEAKSLGLTWWPDWTD